MGKPLYEASLAAYMAEWLAVVRPNLAASTWYGYDCITRKHITPTIGTIPLADLTRRDVQQWVTAQTVKPRTVQYHHAVLRRALNHAIRLDLLKTNPCNGVVLPRQVRYTGRPLTADEATRLLDHAYQSPRWYALYVLALQCGLRRSELAGLQWSNVTEDTITVANTVHRVIGTGLRDTSPKTRNSTRMVPLPTLAREALERLGRKDGYVFVTANGTALAPDNMTRDWNSRRKALGLQSRFHDLRHTYATMLLNAGQDAAIISRLLGHSSVAITMQVYAHVQTPLLQKSAKVMDSVFDSMEQLV